MPSKLSTAPTIIARGVFDSVATFAQLEERISCLGEENTKILGDAFEIFVEALLATQSKFMAEEVFLVGQVPQAIREEMNLPNDSKGIDGIFRTLTGTLVPYQVKFRSNRPQLTFTEVSPFLGLTERATDRIIFTNSNDIAVTAANRDAMRSVRGGDFDELTQQDFESIECWLKEKPISIPKPEPRDYQIEALKSIRETLETNDRATAVMACGTGKTLLALWVTESIKPKTVLVLVPSIALVQQTLEEWSRNNSWGNKFTYICVCSDSRVADGIQEDSIQLKASDVDFPVDTNPHIVRKFLERKTEQIKVVFSTYQSSDVVIEASKGLEPYDIAIFDEAHKTTGPQGGLFALCLSETNIRISKRLFLTATPRHYDIRHKDDNGDFKVVSMDDAEIYGPRAYTLTFGEAAKRGIICDYKVVISVVDGNEISQFSLDHGITLVEGDTIGARWVANQIAIERAINKTGAKRAITFHSRISSAKEFSSDTSRGIKQFLPDFNSFHVSGSQNSSERKQIIRAFREAPKAIITNARCLTEGIDIPAVDMVAFVDPRQSRVDIAQATGRAMRKPRGSDKTTGYVVIPLFVERSGDQSIEEALEASDFAEVNSVLNAMREQDEDLVQIIREMREAKGRGDVFNPTALAEKIELLGPSIDLSVLQANIYAEIVDSIGVSWDEWYGRLVAFKEREGHCRVLYSLTVDNYNLGQWVTAQRSKREELFSDRIRRLDDIGFVWDAQDYQWEEGFTLLCRYREQHGTCKVPLDCVFEHYNLGMWVGQQRDSRQILSEDRRRRLVDIGFVWDAQIDAWENGFFYLVDYYNREKNCRVPRDFTIDNFRLGQWVSVQRLKINELSEIRPNRLLEINFDWDSRAFRWEHSFLELIEFKKREGNCRVSKTHQVGELKLGQWVGIQRLNKAKLPEERRRKLDDIGFDWDPLHSSWEDGYAQLVIYKKAEGDCRVPLNKYQNGYPLGGWVSTQRSHRNNLNIERKQRLDDIGFVWDPLTEKWEEGFSHLKAFKELEKHCRVATGTVIDGFNLGSWVRVQRRNRESISAERIQRLDDIGFVWDPLTEQWEAAFSHLKAFKDRERHCRVPKLKIVDGVNLGSWVQQQRGNRESLSADRIRRLDEIGFVWDPFNEQWEEGFSYLKAFKDRERHCSVPKSNVFDGFNLGAWVNRQRGNRVSLSADRIRRLDEIGFVWDAREKP